MKLMVIAAASGLRYDAPIQKELMSKRNEFALRLLELGRLWSLRFRDDEWFVAPIQLPFFSFPTFLDVSPF